MLFSKNNITKAKKAVIYFLQAIIVYTLFIVFKLIPLDIASAIGGFFGRIIGPLMPKHRLAKANLRLIFPDKTDKEIRKITNKMWDNLGRMMGEYSHIKDFSHKHKDRITIIGAEHLAKAQKIGKGGILVSAHYGNWEMSSSVIANCGVKLNIVYRAPNNYLLSYLFTRRKKTSVRGNMIVKNKQTPIALLRALRNKEFIGILVDQKIKTGIDIEFLGQKTKTSDAAAIFAMKTGCPIIPSIVKRTKGAHFEATMLPLIIPDKSNDTIAEIAKVTNQIKEMIESWIMECPEQWLWIHDRWYLKKSGAVQ